MKDLKPIARLCILASGAISLRQSGGVTAVPATMGRPRWPTVRADAPATGASGSRIERSDPGFIRLDVAGVFCTQRRQWPTFDAVERIGYSPCLMICWMRSVEIRNLPVVRHREDCWARSAVCWSLTAKTPGEPMSARGARTGDPVMTMIADAVSISRNSASSATIGDVAIVMVTMTTRSAEAETSAVDPHSISTSERGGPGT